MEDELSDQFGIEGVDVVTLNSYGKSIAEDQYDDIRFVVDEAKRTDLAELWRELITEKEWKSTYEEFLTAWKESNYEPDDKREIRQTIESHERKLSVGILGEDIGRDDLPEETLAHKEITRLLTAYELDYDYQYAVDWDSESKTEYNFDFRVEDPALDGSLFIEYSPSRETRDDRDWYKNPAYESPEQLRRFFDRMSEFHPEAANGTLIILDGSELLRRPAGETEWDSDRVQSEFRSIVSETVASRIADTTTFAPNERGRLTGLEFYEDAYRRYKCERSVVDQVEGFIDQVRVREWSPSETSERVQTHLEDNDTEEGVRPFCELATEAYRRFDDLYDNRHRTDFHGSLVLTRDLLEAGDVSDRHTYPHVMVDEMQDLNPVQFDIIKELAGQRDDVRVFGVGDDWQSIFGFRGARPDLFINFGVELGADDFADTRLEANHRCPDTVVDTSNAVIRNNVIRTQKDPDGSSAGDPVRVHHLGCDTYSYSMNQTMIDTTVDLLEATPYEPGETQILLRQKEGDQTFYNALRDRIDETIDPTGEGSVDIRTAHDAKGSEAEHVIIPKVMTEDGYPSVNPNKWVTPVKRPPAVYRETNTNYQIEEERRLFYVALTRAKDRLDVLTVEGSESRFIDELPEEHCLHSRPFPEEDLETIDQNGEIRKTIAGIIESVSSKPPVGTLEWHEQGLIQINLFDATEEQLDRFVDLEGQGVELINCGVEYRHRKDEEAEGDRLELQIDEETRMVPLEES